MSMSFLELLLLVMVNVIILSGLIYLASHILKLVMTNKK